MKINGILWLEDIVEKLLWKHQVNKREVIDIFNNRPLIRFVGFDLLKRGTAKEKMCMLLLDKQIQEDTWLSILSAKKIDRRLFYRQEI